MSILIKGMELPKERATYHALVNFYTEGVGSISVTVDNITTTYDMVEIPTPHGRLIDADDYLYRGDLIDEPIIIEAEE